MGKWTNWRKVYHRTWEYGGRNWQKSQCRKWEDGEKTGLRRIAGCGEMADEPG